MRRFDPPRGPREPRLVSDDDRDDGPGRSSIPTPLELRASRHHRVITDPAGVPVGVLEDPARPRSDTDEQIAAAVHTVTIDRRVDVLEERDRAKGKWLAVAVAGAMGSLLTVFGLIYARGASDGIARERLDRALQDIHELRDQVRALEFGRHASVLTPDPAAAAATNPTRTP